MDRIISKEKFEKYGFFLIVFISFITIFLYNIVTPYMSDDFFVDKSLRKTAGDILRQEYISYMTHSGRSVLSLIGNIFMLFPKMIFNFANSLCYVATMLLIYYNIETKRKYDIFLYVLINLCMWIFGVEFAQTILWCTGACNYLWGIFIILGFLSLYRFCLSYGEKNKILKGIILFITGVLAGWCNENTSGGAILIVLLLTAKYYFENKEIKKIVVSGIVGIMVGFVFMLAAPGNAARSAMVAEAETYEGLARYISRGLKVLKSIDEYLLIYIIVICILGAYYYYTKKYAFAKFYETTIFSVAGLATASVLIMTAEPMPRAYFGANIYMMIAALQMIQMIREEDTVILALKNGGIIAATIAMMFVYVEEGANLVRIRRELDMREAYILEEKAKGEEDLVLPALRPVFETKYSWAHYIDISNDETNWNNNLYEEYYDINIVEVLPWAEWEEAVGRASEE